MEGEPEAFAESPAYPATNDSGCGGAFFAGAQHFTIAGGIFNNFTNSCPTTHLMPSDFRLIPLGDLDLRPKMGLDGRSVAMLRPQGRACMRRIYSARIHGSKPSMTAALYEGDRAEERWREDISRYSELRHPNLFQLYGMITSGSLHAAVFHDDVISALELVEKYRNSHFSTVFFWACMDGEFLGVHCLDTSFNRMPLP
ncbi:hypothetical protein B0H19DRAFT_647046 [Mycena capillaripes]|nr:hypothetical protein B0H19DRAFT_647046 [Mycena capillaripes]